MIISHDLSTAKWHKSSHSDNNGGNCIEVAQDIPSLVPVRDSKNPDGPTLTFNQDAWTTFITAIKTGELPTT